MEIWYTEKQTENLAISFRLKETLVREQTQFQDLAIVDTLQYGKMLVLDNCVMTTEVDEFVYHEMITHVALHTHPNPKKVLVIGGGDGGAMREIIKHPSVERAVMVEIDGRVIDTCKEHLPSISCALSDPRVEVMVDDGIKFVKEARDEFDVILSDSTDPIGPAVGLFSAEFYRDAFNALKDDGIFVAQSESPFLHPQLIKDVQSRVSSVFPITRLYLASIPTYPSGLWSFTMGSKKYDPATPRPLTFDTKYYTTELHQAAFKLPRFALELVAQPAAQGPMAQGLAAQGLATQGR